MKTLNKNKSAPTISIITINKNNLEGLKTTIKSIKSQNHQPDEHIIVDGTSVDKSLEFIALEKRYNPITHILDKGQGIYEAMNIGLKECSSEYTIFLNSGDYFYNKDSLKHLALEASGNEIIYGNIAIKDIQSGLLIKRPAEKIWYHKKYQHSLPYFPACLIKTDLLQKEGGFREDMRISSDVDMLSKLALKKSRFKHVDIPITIFDQTGISSKYKLLAFKERIKILFQTRKVYILSLFITTAYSYFKR